MTAVAAAQPKTSVSALSVDNVSHAYGARIALAGVSFDVAPGSFTVLLGLNGAGKSTLFSVITHLYVSRSGSVRIFGRDVALESGAALSALGVVFQQRTLDPDLSVAQNLAYHGALHGIGRRETRARQAVQLARVGLADRAGDKVRFLSIGRACCCSTSRRRGSTSRREPGFSRSCGVSSPSKGSASSGRPISLTRFATTIT
jgi:ABC-2 type transport system ATP-binding protein